MAMQIREYNAKEAVSFRKTNEEFGGLSNMASHYHLNINGVIIPSSEALYQACRYPLFPYIQHEIINQDNGMKAKMISKKYHKYSRQDWEQVKIKIMRWCLEVKLSQNYDKFSDLLRKTGSKAIVELTTKDKVWGAIQEGDKLIGVNALGRLLMELRDKYVHTNQSIICVDPPNVVGMLLYGHPLEVVCNDSFNEELQFIAESDEYELA